MNLRNLFSKRSNEPSAPERRSERAPEEALDMDVLDACVGGRVETHGVGCYAHSTEPRRH